MKYDHFSTLPIGAFQPMLGRMRLHGGGGNPIDDVVNTVSDAVSGIGQDISNLGSSASNAVSGDGFSIIHDLLSGLVGSVGQDISNLPSSVSDVAAQVGSAVDNNVPGGWGTVGALALTAATMGASSGLLGADAAATGASIAGDGSVVTSLSDGSMAVTDTSGVTSFVASDGTNLGAIDTSVSSLPNVDPNVGLTPQAAQDVSNAQAIQNAVIPTDNTQAITNALPTSSVDANTQALANALSNPTLPPADTGTLLANAPTVTSDVAPTITDQALASAVAPAVTVPAVSATTDLSTLPTLGQNYTGTTLGTIGNGLTDVAPATGLGTGLANTGILSPLVDASTIGAGAGGAATGSLGTYTGGLAGLTAADLASTPAASTGGSLLSSLLPSSTLGQAALLSGATGLASSLIGANASQNAANTQAQAAQNAQNLTQQMFNTQNAQLAPNRAAGYNALNQLQGNLSGPYQQYDANGNPIGTAQGTGYFTNQMTPSDYANYMSPYYQFGLNQGLGQATNIANATGGRLSGNALQGLNQYAQNYAQTGAQQAFQNYQTQRTNIYNTLAGIAGLGQTAQGTTANLASNTANALSNLQTGSAAAQAAGQIGQAGAYTGGLSNIGNNFLLASLLNPSSSGYTAPAGGYASTLGSLNLG